MTIKARALVVVVCAAVVAARVAWPERNIDTTAVVLIGVAVLVLLTPSLDVLAKHVRRVNLWGAEVEFGEQVAAVGEKVEAAEAAVGARRDLRVPAEGLDEDLVRLMTDAGRDPRASLLLLSARIEELVRARLAERVPESRRPVAMPKLVEAGIRARVFPEEVLAPFRDFWAIRNRVAHGEARDYRDGDLWSLVSLGVELHRLLNVLTEEPREEVMRFP